jgi:hypothetical protein
MVLVSKIEQHCNDLDLLKEGTPEFISKLRLILSLTPHAITDDLRQQKLRAMYGYLLNGHI